MQQSKLVTLKGPLQPPYKILQHPGTRQVSQKQFVLNFCGAKIDLLQKWQTHS